MFLAGPQQATSTHTPRTPPGHTPAYLTYLPMYTLGARSRACGRQPRRPSAVHAAWWSRAREAEARLGVVEQIRRKTAVRSLLLLAARHRLHHSSAPLPSRPGTQRPFEATRSSLLTPHSLLLTPHSSLLPRSERRCFTAPTGRDESLRRARASVGRQRAVAIPNGRQDPLGSLDSLDSRSAPVEAQLWKRFDYLAPRLALPPTQSLTALSLRPRQSAARLLSPLPASF